MNNDYIVQATDVHKIYHTGLVSVPALRGIDLSVSRGEMLAVMGPSGCGKATLLNCLSGLDTPDEGQISIEGVSLSGMSDHDRTDYRVQRVRSLMLKTEAHEYPGAGKCRVLVNVVDIFGNDTRQVL
jgi:putative ABC transport system ATP-binding protein